MGNIINSRNGEVEVREEHKGERSVKTVTQYISGGKVVKKYVKTPKTDWFLVEETNISTFIPYVTWSKGVQRQFLQKQYSQEQYSQEQLHTIMEELSDK